MIIAKYMNISIIELSLVGGNTNHRRKKSLACPLFLLPCLTESWEALVVFFEHDKVAIMKYNNRFLSDLTYR